MKVFYSLAMNGALDYFLKARVGTLSPEQDIHIYKAWTYYLDWDHSFDEFKNWLTIAFLAFWNGSGRFGQQ